MSKYTTLICADPTKFRQHMRQSFADRFQMSLKSATNLEIGIYNYAIRESNKERIVKKWENKMYAHLYMDRMRSLWMNLLHHYTLKTPTSGGVLSDNGNSIHALEKCEDLKNSTSDNDTSLLTMWKTGEITPEQMSAMTHQEMNPARWRPMIEKQMKRDASSDETRASTDMFTCKKCKSKKCSYYELQTRSADEPSTIFITCLDCGKNWKQ